MDLGYNKLVLYPRPITLAKTYVRFYRCDGPYYMTEKTGKVFEVSSIDSKKTAFFAPIIHHFYAPVLCVCVRVCVFCRAKTAAACDVCVRARISVFVYRVRALSSGKSI